MGNFSACQYIHLPYGRGWKVLQLPRQNFAGIIEATGGRELRDVGQALENSLNNPIGAPALAKLIDQRQPRNAVIIVSDHTRRIPGYSLVLEAVMDQFAEGGVDPKSITMLVATGNHRQPTRQECLELYGERACRAMKLAFHDSDRGCMSLRPICSDGRPEINRMLVNSDFVLATGKITPHYLAGFSGGRKAVMPGCASRSTIAANHSLVTRGRNHPGRLRGNPIHRQMVQVAAMAGIDFLVNLVPAPGGGLAGIVSGHWDLAWRSGVRLCRRVWSAGIGRPADCAIVSAGGYPHDINLYQMQRLLNNLAGAVKPGGTILLVGECQEGVGQAEFGRWMAEKTVGQILATPEALITGEAHRAYATAMVMKDHQVLLLSRMAKAQARRMKFWPVCTIREAVEIFKIRHGEGFRCYVSPRANALLLHPTKKAIKHSNQWRE